MQRAALAHDERRATEADRRAAALEPELARMTLVVSRFVEGTPAVTPSSSEAPRADVVVDLYEDRGD